MRRGTQDTAIFVSEDGVFQGVCLGWDFTSEHEWGIKGITRDYGLREVSRQVVGIEARRIQRMPDHLEITTFGNVSYLTSRSRWHDEDLTKKDLNRIMEAYDTYDRGPIQGAWDEKSFGVRVEGKENQEYLDELLDAFMSEDVIIAFGSGDPTNPFGNSGLMLLIASRLPQDYIDASAKADNDRLDLTDAAAATGIAKRLADAGLKYFALNPKRWADEEKTEPLFWLNPMGQKEFNTGWMTVADLDDWIAGKGKVVKEKGNG